MASVNATIMNWLHVNKTHTMNLLRTSVPAFNCRSEVDPVVSRRISCLWLSMGTQVTLSAQQTSRTV